MERFVTIGKEFGLEGKELLAIMKEQQDKEKRRLDEERGKKQRKCQSKKLKVEEQERIRQHKLVEKEQQSKERE